MCRCLRFWKRSLKGGDVSRGGPALAGQQHGRRHSRGASAVAVHRSGWCNLSRGAEADPHAGPVSCEFQRESRVTSGRDEFLTGESELRMQLDAWKSGDQIFQNRYIDTV